MQPKINNCSELCFIGLRNDDLMTAQRLREGWPYWNSIWDKPLLDVITAHGSCVEVQIWKLRESINTLRLL